MKRTKIRIIKKRIRNLIILGILLFSLIVAYKMYPQSKSEKIITANVTYIDSISKEEVGYTINTNDYDNGYYFELPENVNGFQVEKYCSENIANGAESEKYLKPGDRYYLSEEEINSEKLIVNAVYDTKESNNETLYFKKLQSTVGQNEILIEGYMPKNADISVKEADFKNVENKIKQKDDTLNLNIAYDIKILVGEEKYEPNEFDENVKVTVSGIVDKENPAGLKVIHIDDENQIEELKTISIEEENLSFNTESFSIFAIVSPSVNYSQTNSAWNGSVATGYSYGTGTINNPYLIADGSELAYLATQVNNGNSYRGKYFKLIANINLNNNVWTPIGTASNSFSGFFDGQGYSISNAKINANGTRAQSYAYGIFGSMNGNSSNIATMQNVVFDNIKVNITFPSQNINTNFAYKIGIASGAMYRYTKIENVIAKNSTISSSNGANISNNARPAVYAGGIVGETAYSSSSSYTKVTSGAYIINNCFSDVDIDFTLYPNNIQGACKLNAGGILGRDSWSATWPTSCLYTGTIGTGNSNMMIGPIVGGETNKNSEIVSSYDALSLEWELDPNLTMTSYYTNYTGRGKSYNSTWTHGATPASTTYRNSDGPWWYDYVAGVNKGIYTNSLETDMLNMFNQNAENSGLSRWIYSNGTFSLQPGLDLTVTETETNLYTFNITPQSAKSNPQYTYSWYVNNTLDNSRTTNTATFEPSFSNTRTVQVIVSDGTYVSLAKFTLEKLTLGLTITQNNGTLYPEFTGTGAGFVSFSDFNIKWSEIDVIEGTLKEIATTQNMPGANLYHEYQIDLSNGRYEIENLSATYLYGDRKVVYVNNVGYTINRTSYVGNNNNNGATPQTAVKTMERAYQLLGSTGTTENNIIIVMGNYDGNEYLDVRGGNASSYNSCVSKFSKAALVSGKYKGTNYNARMFFACEDNQYNGRYICADTRFEYITFNGNNGRTFLYLQGHDITMGSGIVMSNYGSIDGSDFGQIKGLGTPNFNMFCGFHNYNYSSIPEQSKVCNVLIKSGTFGRVVTGGRNNSNSESILQTSHNIFGRPNDHFTANITIDYINQATGTTPDINLLVAGTTDGCIYTDTTLNISSGKVARILGGSIGSNTIIFNGYPLNLFVGSTTMNISGGDITEIFGTSLGRWTNEIYYFGDIKINISGGIIRNAIYGAGAASITGNNPDNQYQFYSQYVSGVNTSTEINISGGEILGNVYGGGYGYSNYLTTDVRVDGGSLYGNSNINITGGKITGNIFGAGRGYNYTNKTYLAEMKGNSTINISGTPTITGNVYGAGEGISGCDGIAKLIGNSTINIASDLSSYIYGGGLVAKLTGNTSVNINSGNNTGTIYGGGSHGDITGNSSVVINGGNVNTVYSGGDLATVRNTNLEINGGTTNLAYAGGNQATVQNTNVEINDGSIATIYGGGNKATANNTNLNINGGTITTLYGGGNEANVSTSSILMEDGNANRIYGGGNKAGVNSTDIEISGGEVEKLFGGSNTSGNVNETNVVIQDGIVHETYGGNNDGGSTSNTNVYICGGTANDVYGGGNNVFAQNTNVYLRDTKQQAGNIYGGGNNAGASTTNIYLQGGEAENVYGGANNSGTVAKSNIFVGDENQTEGIEENNNEDLIVSNVYGGNNAGGQTTETKIYCYSGQIENIYGGGNRVNSPTTNVNIQGGTIGNVFGGSNQTGNVTNANVLIEGGNTQNVFGGNNAGGTTTNANVIVNEGTVINVYGGNNEGGLTTNAYTEANGGTITNVFGGGDKAATNNATLNVNSSKILGSVYGGGNQAAVNSDTHLNLNGANITTNVYGGGNEGIVLGNTYAKVTNSAIDGSIYAGGNGVTAIVSGNTNLVIEGTTNIQGHAFGGGNQAATGTQGSNNSISTVEISGGNIGGNVYGGANTSVVYGITNVNIGNSIQNINSLQKADIIIGGTVFGGGEANEAGDENYDFSFISVTNGTNINIDAAGYDNFRIEKSIFGSGNASTTAGQSVINVSNYGSFESPKSNISIQRANEVTLNNCAIWLDGATDRTNEHSNVLFSLSRIDELKLKNNSTLFLQNGANLLKKLSSLVDNGNTEEKGTVTIDKSGNITKNVDNRIYMREGINLNVAENEQANVYGDVNGMFFLGLYTGKNRLSLGIYSKEYENGDEIELNDKLVFTRNSYVLGEHYNEHDITKDGFYSNFKTEDDLIKVNYIEPTPSDQVYYIWNVGELADAVIYEIQLTASKYNTLGTKELSLLGFGTPNTVFEYSGSTYDLVDGISLVDKNQIKNVEENQNIADTKFGLGIETGRNGWSMTGKTKFLSDEPYYSGTTTYLSENSATTPILNFYLYHSQNLSVEHELGTAIIALTAIQQVDDLNKEMKNILIYVNMDTALYQDDYYESSITPGEKYELFTNTLTNITSNSEFSQYYSLYIDEFSNNDYYKSYLDCHRTLISSTPLPANTTITMIDMMTNSTEYYYYTVTAQDEINRKTKFDITNFKKMGSTDQFFDEDNTKYYNSQLDVQHEEFIFHFDFSNANITNEIENQTIFLECRNNDEETLISVLGDLRENLEFSIYPAGSNISVNATASKPSLYLGQELFLNIETNYNQTIINNKVVYDTNYFGDSSGLKITFLDSNGEQVSGSSLLGVHFELNGNKYYPRTDGTTRIKTAEKVSNVASNIKVITENSNMASGSYTIKIEAFSSPDGIYYGLESADEVTIPLVILNSIYGLKANLDDNMVIINSKTGLTQNNNNNLVFNLEFASGVTSPNIKVGLYRRDYENVYSYSYNLVDMQNYVANELTTTDISDIYLVTNNPSKNFDFSLNLKDNLVTGTYKVVFSLYDGDVYIGEVYQYIIIN